MKHKWFVTLGMICCLLLGAAQPLTVSAEVSATQQVPDIPHSPDESWGSMNDYGFANDMMIVMSLYDGLDEKEISLEGLDKFHIMSAHLESGHFYQARLDFFVVIDRKDMEKYDDVNLQVRFPATLLAGSPNAIGYSVNGSKLETWHDTFGITSDETLDLYYLNDSGQFDTFASKMTVSDTGIDRLFSSAQGMNLQSVFQDAFEDSMVDGAYEVSFFSMMFVIYAAPHQGAINPDDCALNYWAGEKLMMEPRITPAPEASYHTASLSADGKVSLANNAMENQSHRKTGVAIFVALLIIAVAIVIGALHCRKLHAGRRRCFLDYFLKAMRLSDDDDDENDDYFDPDQS